jgi:hypothetical protein
MGLYFYFHVVRRVPDPNKANFFITDAPHDRGVHSSYMDLLFDQTVQIDPALSPKPDWYRNVFSCTGQAVTQANFFEPAELIRDLERIMAEIMRRNAQLPVHHWLLIGNKAGITEVLPLGSVEIYYENEPCVVNSDWDGIYIWGPKGKVRDITGVNSFDCRLRRKTVATLRAEVNPQHDDGMDGTVYFERVTFFDFMRPYLFDLFRQCDWALRHRLQVFPMWS